MRYLSPATLTGLPVSTLTDKKSLQLQKKKLLAELDLSADGQLRIGEGVGPSTAVNASATNGAGTLTKSDILEYFDTLENETILRYHDAVSKDKTLVEFLENSRLNIGTSFAPSSLYEDPAFLEWISPYFYTAFTGYVKTCLQNTDETGLKNLFLNPQLLTEYDRERAWIEIARTLEDNVAILENYQGQATRKKARPDINGVSPLVSDPYVRMILQFPKAAFGRVRDNYAFTLMQLSIILFNKSRLKRGLADTWIYKAKTLAVSESIYNQVAAKAAEMDRIKKKGETAILTRIVIIVGIALLKFIFSSGVGCNAPKTTSGSGNTYTKANPTPCAIYPPRPFRASR